jgi:hypothetical protein
MRLHLLFHGNARVSCHNKGLQHGSLEHATGAITKARSMRALTCQSQFLRHVGYLGQDVSCLAKVIAALFLGHMAVVRATPAWQGKSLASVQVDTVVNDHMPQVSSGLRRASLSWFWFPVPPHTP